MEFFGLELIGPVSAAAARQKIESIKILIDGSEVDDIVFNERMAPAWNPATMNQNPFFGGNGAYSALPAGMVYNLGVPLLMGGSPIDATIKVGPQETLGFRIKAPRTTEGGGTINENVKIRANVVEAKTQSLVERTLNSYGLASGGSINQSFQVMDLSTNDLIDVQKNVPLDLDHWTSLHGGQAAAKPYVTNYITYAQNAVATTTNSAYRFTMEGARVLHDDMKFYWNLRPEEGNTNHTHRSEQSNKPEVHANVRLGTGEPWQRMAYHR